MFQNKTMKKKKKKKFDGLTRLRTHSPGTASAPYEALETLTSQTLTSQGQMPCRIATILEKFLGGAKADMMLENNDPVF